jgi:DNA polymerase
MATYFKVDVDVETGSVPNLKAAGHHRYATDPSTRVWLMAYRINDGAVKLWRCGDPVPGELIEAAADPACEWHAHNAQFERAIFREILTPAGFPDIPLERWRCTMARALAMALPAKLELLCEALGFENRKGDASAMHKLAKPRKPRKGEDPNQLYWNDTPENLEALGRYCIQDVECESEADRKLLPLSESEQELWFIDQRINDRGFAIDRDLTSAAIPILDAAGRELIAEFQGLTGIESPGCVAKLIAWLAGHDCKIDDLQKKTVSAALTRKDLTSVARRALEIRQGAAHASAGKAEALEAWCCDDGRVRGTLQFHGAATGRWAAATELPPR